MGLGLGIRIYEEDNEWGEEQKLEHDIEIWY